MLLLYKILQISYFPMILLFLISFSSMFSLTSVHAEIYEDFMFNHIIENGRVEKMHLEDFTLAIEIKPYNAGSITADIPKFLVNSYDEHCNDALLTTLLDNMPIDYNESKNTELFRSITMNFTVSTEKLTVIATNSLPVMNLQCNDSEPVPNSINMSPKKQSDMGVTFNNIVCNSNLQLIQTLDEEPVCVKEQSISKLIERGWANKTIVSDIQEEDHVVLITVSKNEMLSKGVGFDLSEDVFTREDLKELQEREKTLQKIADNPKSSYEESSAARKEIIAMQDRLQNPFQTGVPYHLIKILKEKHEVFLSHHSDLIGVVWWTGSSPHDISHAHHAQRIGIDSDHFTLSELEYQDKKIREYLGNEMNILYKKSGYITYER